MARTAAPQDEPDKPQAAGGPITSQKIADGSITAERIVSHSASEPEPRWVRVTIPDYPNVTHLLFHDDGRVTWK